VRGQENLQIKKRDESYQVVLGKVFSDPENSFPRH
jgi:hypothetical protein